MESQPADQKNRDSVNNMQLVLVKEGHMITQSCM